MATRRERVFYEMTATDNASRVFRQVEGSATSLGSAYRQVHAAVLLLASGGFASSLVRAAQQGEQSQNRLTASLKATGNQVGITRAELDGMADALAAATQFDDDAIRNAQGQLVKFGNIQGQVFRDALKISADLAAFMGTDLQSAAQQVGRALQSPTEGITLLERHIGKLTEAQEKNIKTLAAQGRAAEAQNAVLKILQERVGGTADLMNTGLTKATSDVAKAWDDMLESWGRSEVVGGRIARMLGGIRDILNDLEIKKADPFEAFNAALARGNTAIETLERNLRERRAQRRAYGGPNVPDDPDFARIQARIDQMRGQRQAILDQMQGMRRQMAFEEGLTPAPKQAALGGNIDLAAIEAAKKLADARRAQQDEQFAMRYQMAAEREAAFNSPEALEKQLASLGKLSEEQQRVNANWIESAELASEAADEMIYTWDAAGNRVQLTREAFDALEESQRKAMETSKELGWAFSSAFEDAIIEGAKLRDVVQGLGKDVLRIILRQQVTQPIATGLAGIFSGLFGGGSFNTAGMDVPGRAAGGPVMGGRAYLVGEQGPELFMPGSGGQIVPNGAGGVTIVQNISVDARSDRSSVLQAMNIAKEQAKAEIQESLARGSGRFAPR